MANQTKYWKGLAHLNNDATVAEQNQKEFAEYIPVEEFVGDKSTLEANTSRRDFLKFLGFSTVAATLAACEAPVTKAVPYVNRPEEITPGVANWYASTFFDGYDYASIIVKTREGRPIKIEGNEMSKLNGGGTNARTQAAVLSLYDSTRVRNPKQKAGNAWADKTWSEVDGVIAEKLNASKGIAIVSSTIISPSTMRAIGDFKKEYGNVQHVMYDAVSYAGVIKANASTQGKAMIPTYSFDKADVIVGIGCDFLGNWLTGPETERQYGITRKVSSDKKTMSKHFQFEAQLSLTGANADERFPVKPSEYGAIALGILSAVGGEGVAATVAANEVQKVADALKSANGRAVVVCGSNDPAIQVVVNLINKQIGAYGTTINTDVEDFTHQGDDAALQKLVSNMGAVDTVIFYNANPAYTAPKALGFAEALKNVATKITFATHVDETAALCDFILPDHNFLEAWGDHMPRTGHYSMQQPAIRPLFSTRHAQESFIKWSGGSKDYMSYVKETWSGMQSMQSNFGDFNAFWISCVRDGVFDAQMPKAVTAISSASGPVTPPEKQAEKSAADTVAQGTDAAPVATVPGSISYTGGTMTLAEAKSQIAAAKSGAFEITMYTKNSLGSGNMANNPWLQEMPDPITKVTWDNYVTMHPLDAKNLNLFGMTEDDMMVRFDQMEDNLDMVSVTVNGHTVELPVWVQPGQKQGTIGVALGYGRTGFNEYIDAIGKNIYPALGMSAAGTMVYTGEAAVSKLEGQTYRIAATQTHHTMMGRNDDILRETTLSAYKLDDRAGNPLNTMHTYKGEQLTEEVSLWNDFERPAHKWAMAIDLSACLGCGSCVVACTVENNVPVVGRDEIRKSREMHWLRIDRYYSSDTVKEKSEESGEMGTMEMYRHMENPTFDNPKVAFQPIMCQHCNHAGCETVCPVIATTHSNEGLNQMTYNRCVGTRYCANNCPYKVRRFNWFNYVEYHRFKGLNPAQDDIGRMVLNPDVTVRARGVMEKCSMCSQRIQAGKLDAKKAGRKIVDGEIKTACQQACPTDAIIFGDLLDPESRAAKMEKDGRKFEVLENTGSRPSVFYMTKVWNREDENAHI
jgi:molybdopterin-containing oxidoreductase family iron-sulfur binding subunit